MSPDERYAPDAPEGAASYRSQYVTRKDAKGCAIFLAVFALLSVPVYMQLRREGEQTTCSQNMKSMKDAILVYSENFDGSLPPAYYQGFDGEPAELNGLPVTWAGIVQENMNPRHSFRCPTSAPEEVTRVAPFVGNEPIELTYGMYAVVAQRTRQSFRSPETVIMLAETVPNGARGTYNPAPFANGNDGFLIGLGASNAYGDAAVEEDSITAETFSRDASAPAPASRATRLAFFDAPEAQPRAEGPARHGDWIHVIYLDGRLERVRSGISRVNRLGADILAPWSLR